VINLADFCWTDFSREDADRRRNNEYSSLFCAIRGGRHNLIPDLLALGADINLTNYKGESALLWACRSDKAEYFLSYFEEARPLPNDGSLHDVAKRYRPDILKMLLTNGHDPNYRSELHDGRTVLEEICLNHHRRCCERYEPGICPISHDTVNSGGRDSECRRLRIEDSIRLLMSHGAKIQTEPLVPGAKQSIFLAIDNGHKNGYDLVYILLSNLFSRPKGLLFRELSRAYTNFGFLAPDEWLYLNDGLCRSPLIYLEDKPNGGVESAKLLSRMNSCGLRRRRYKLTGPQPVNAVGEPPEILRAEEERKLRELLLRTECTVCGEPTTDPRAVHGALTSSCIHKWSIVICRKDLQTYLATRIAPEDGRVSSSIPCWAPNCNAILRHHDIQQHANIQDFEAYDDALLRQAIHAGESFAECSTSGCRGGGWVDSTSDITYFVCDLCYRATCIEHNGPYETHAGKPCPATAYRRAQTERERERREKEDKASEKLLKRTAQLGPCGHWISKIDGCNHMTCTCFPLLSFWLPYLPFFSPTL
jgi:hypothetical protein